MRVFRSRLYLRSVASYDDRERHWPSWPEKPCDGVPRASAVPRSEPKGLLATDAGSGMPFCQLRAIVPSLSGMPRGTPASVPEEADGDSNTRIGWLSAA